MSEAKVHSFQAEVSQVLKLVVNSLYSHKEIFLRELISNASDAVDKLRFESLQHPEWLGEDSSLHIRLVPDEEAKTLTISDTGIGMSEEELVANLGTIARSGTREFLEKLKEAQESKDLQLIGQFGVGFYSAFLVATKVEVVTRRAGEAGALRWTSEAGESYTVEAAERDTPGTDVILHIGSENAEYLKPYRLRQLVSQYSDYVEHAIEMPKAKEDDSESTAVEFEQINHAAALWQKNPSEVEPEQYVEFYKHLSHDWEAPLAHKHFKVEGTQMFSGLVFLPGRPPFDMFDNNAKHGVRLHVKRVFVMDNCEELLPKYLRFVKGLVDSEDLPLNVSREILQDSRAVRIIRKQVVNHVLSMIEDVEANKPEEFTKFWASFGAVLKEGLHFGVDDKERLGKLLRYESTGQEGVTSLKDYIGRMKEDQEAIYYATGTEKKLLETSPHLERLKKRGFEVLLMTDPVDPFAVQGLTEFEGKSLVNAMESNLELKDEEVSDEEKEKKAAVKKESEPLLERFKSVLGARVAEVRPSERLTDSAVCLVTPEGGVAPHIERLMRAQNQALPPTKRILEVNLDHPVLQQLRARNEEQGEGVDVQDWISLLYDQALIAEGSPLEDPAAFGQRLSRLMQAAAPQ